MAITVAQTQNALESGNTFSINSGSPTLTCTSGNFFASNMAGATMTITGAGAGGTDLVTTISSVTSLTVATLAANAGTSVTSVRGFIGSTKGAGAGTSTESITIAGAILAADAIWVTTVYDPAVSFTSMSDNLGNTWLLAGSEISNADYKYRLYYCLNPIACGANGLTITFHYSAAPAYNALNFGEPTGSLGQWNFEAFATGNSTNTNCVTGTFSTTRPNSIVFFVSGVDSHVTALGAGYTDAIAINQTSNNTPPPNTDNFGDVTQYQVFTTVQTNITATVTQASNAIFVVGALALSTSAAPSVTIFPARTAKIPPLTSPLLSPFILGAGLLAPASPPPSGAITCTMNGVGAMSATLTGAGALTMTAAGVGALSANLTGSGSLAATMAGIGALSATWTESLFDVGPLRLFQRALAFPIDRPIGPIAVLGTGIVAPASPPTNAISATFNGVGALSANLIGSGALTMTANGVGALSATLTAAGALSMTAAGVGALSATLTGSGALAMTAAGVGALSATWSESLFDVGTIKLFQRALTFPIDRPIGSIAVLGTGLLAPTQPSTPGQLNATMNGVGALSANLTGAGALASTFNGIGAMSATLTGIGTLSDTMNGVGALSATLGGSGALSATFNGVGALGATLGGSGALAATLNGIGTLFAQLPGAMVATLNGVGALSATLGGAGALSGTFVGVGALSATLGGVGILTMTSAGVGTLSATLAGTGALASTMSGVGALFASISGGAGATFVGVGALSATPQGAGSLSSVMAGVGGLVAIMVPPLLGPLVFVLFTQPLLQFRVTTDMQNYDPGQSVRVSLQSTVLGQPSDPNTLTQTIVLEDRNGNVISTGSPVQDAVGFWHCDFILASNLTPSDVYAARWTSTGVLPSQNANRAANFFVNP